jgi:hypothetical protein
VLIDLLMGQGFAILRAPNEHTSPAHNTRSKRLEYIDTNVWIWTNLSNSQKLRVVYAVKKLSVIYGTRKVLSVFTTTRY